MKPKAIVTMPPYAPYLDEVLAHPAVSGIRLNTVMPVKGTLEDILSRLKNHADKQDKDVYIDLKCRQLRVKTYGVPPFTEIELTHNITVRTPVKAYFSDGKESATVLEIDGNKLIMQEGPKRVVGPGESVNILDHSLHIDGYFTDRDKAYIEAGQKVGIASYMLSFVEGQEDIDELHKLAPDVHAVAKIESRKGLDFVRHRYDGKTRLMCARGDLYVEVGLPHKIIEAERLIVKRNPQAIIASRILPSLSESLEPDCRDINDVDNLLRMDYRTVMLGDDICQHRDSVISALNLYEAIASSYETKHSKIIPVHLFK